MLRRVFKATAAAGVVGVTGAYALVHQVDVSPASLHGKHVASHRELRLADAFQLQVPLLASAIAQADLHQQQQQHQTPLRPSLVVRFARAFFSSPVFHIERQVLRLFPRPPSTSTPTGTNVAACEFSPGDHPLPWWEVLARDDERGEVIMSWQLAGMRGSTWLRIVSLPSATTGPALSLPASIVPATISGTTTTTTTSTSAEPVNTSLIELPYRYIPVVLQLGSAIDRDLGAVGTPLHSLYSRVLLLSAAFKMYLDLRKSQ
ncbi:hypothetical protein RI367_006575 [Sorochytrium milnesiophthora]